MVVPIDPCCLGGGQAAETVSCCELWYRLGDLLWAIRQGQGRVARCHRVQKLGSAHLEGEYVYFRSKAHI